MTLIVLLELPVVVSSFTDYHLKLLAQIISSSFVLHVHGTEVIEDLDALTVTLSDDPHFFTCVSCRV